MLERRASGCEYMVECGMCKLKRVTWGVLVVKMLKIMKWRSDGNVHLVW